MRVLIANHHLDHRAGSELWCAELCTGLKERGHEVGAFAFVLGGVASRLRAAGIRVFGPDDGAAIEEFAPEIVHLQHSPTLYLLGSLRLTAPVVYSVLGVSPPLEAPPLAWEGVVAATCVSEEVRDAVAGSPFGEAVPLDVLRNWFDDRGLRPGGRPAPERVERIAVVTNHLSPELRAQLAGLEARRGVRWEHFGLPGRSVAIDAALLRPFDVVITIGRTALLAGALGIPCLLYDVHGCDGFLAPGRIAALATRNFSGRLEARRPEEAELEHLLMSCAPAVPTEEVAATLWEGFTLSSRIAALEERYRSLVGRPGLGEATRRRYGRAGAIHREVLATTRALSEQVQERVAALAEARTLRETLERCAREIQALEASRRELAASNEMLQDALRVTSRERSGVAWWAVTRLRAVKHACLPEGTWRRTNYERLLERARARIGLAKNPRALDRAPPHGTLRVVRSAS